MGKKDIPEQRSDQLAEFLGLEKNILERYRKKRRRSFFGKQCFDIMIMERKLIGTGRRKESQISKTQGRFYG